MMASARNELHEFEVLRNEELAQGIWRLVLHAPRLSEGIRPGQFMNLEVPGDNSHILRIPLSFSRADARAGVVELVYAVVGEGTRRLSQMGPGAVSTLVGPAGHGWRLPSVGPVLLVAGGVGAPPVIAAAEMLSLAGLEFDAIFGAQTAARLWGPERAHDLGARRVAITTDDGTAGVRGFTTQAMERLLATEEYAQVMTCGPLPMMAGVVRLAQASGLSCQVSMERMMGCGFGACNCCNIAAAHGGYKSCCMDGPVFGAEELAW